MAKKSFGVTVTIGGTAVPGLTDVSISGRDVNNIDVTNHASPDNAREFIGGLIDNGTLELTGNFDLADAGVLTLMGYAGMNKATVVTFSDNTTASFDIVVGVFNVTNPLDDKIEQTVSSKISGAITFAD